MAKKRIGKCVHCLKDNVPLTDDHVFPKSWYPENTPANIEKWTIPACLPCNNEHGKSEQDLLVRLGLCIAPQYALGVVPKALRSISSQYAKDEQDARHRKDKREKLLRQVLTGNDIPRASMYPNLGERWGRPLEQQHIITISAEQVRRLGEKIVRGIFYIEDGRFIEPPYVIEVHVVHDENIAEVIVLIDRFGKIYAREPGIIVHRAAVPEDTMYSLLKIEIEITQLKASVV